MDARFQLLLIFTFNHVLADSSIPTTYTLNDGNEIPVVALGTSLGHLPNGRRLKSANNSLPVARAVRWALEAGYRHIETASIYRVEFQVGLGVNYYLFSSGKNRSDLYITTKLWNDAHEKDEVIPALKKSLADLHMDYVDLYLMHYPMAFTKNGTISLTDYLTTWEAMEEAKMMNLTRSIGVCNFNLTQMQRLWNASKIKPAVLQIKVNPISTQNELVNWCNAHGVIVMAYSPFGFVLGSSKIAPPPRANDPYLQILTKKYGKNVPQILLRYLLDRNMVVVPRTTHKNRIWENIDVLDFTLSPQEVELISDFNCNHTLRTPAKWYDHPHFPFEKINVTLEYDSYNNIGIREV